MKIETRNEPKAKIKLISGDAFRIDTASYLSKLHTVCIAVAKRGSFRAARPPGRSSRDRPPF